MTIESTYKIYGGELSYFTRKLEAAMIFYAAPFEMFDKNEHNPQEIEARSQTHQVPVLLTPENWMIGDTTPLMHLLDDRFPARRMFPEGPLGILVQVVEEFFDEWVARTMVHYRWHYPESAEFASLKMANGNSEIAERVRSWGPRACRATGTESEQQRRACEEEYRRMLVAAERQLKDTAFLLGDRPTAVDAVVLGGIRAHTNMDPVPRKMMADFPQVVEWAEKTADEWNGAGGLADFPESTAFARFVFDEMVSTYQPYVLGNRDAQAAGAKAFHATIYGEDVSYLSRPYPEQSRRMILARIDTLSAAEQSAVRAWLDRVKLSDCFGAWD